MATFSDASAAGTITLIGSGELTEAMGKVYRRLMASIKGPLHAVFLDTPAGFQLNADEIAARAVEYFAHRFGLTLAVASFKNSTMATAAELQTAVRELRRANYIFAGPGSPSYAAHHWRHSPIGAMLGERLTAGAQLVLASAAATAVGKYTVPVYEIYKVGQEPHWIAGLDLLGPHGFDLAVIPHWNNQEGGTHDTRYAYLGEPRLRIMEADLPPQTVILGIDEHTAGVVDLAGGSCQVWGAGGVTIRQQGRERFFASGESFSTRFLAEGPGAAASGSIPISITERATTEGARPSTDEPESPAPLSVAAEDLVAVLVEVRERLRQERQWELADEIRDHLAELGIALEDRPEGTAWLRR